MDAVASEDAVMVAVASGVAEQESVPDWPMVTRIGFRVSFLWFVFFIFASRNGSIFSLLPRVGNWIDSTLNWLPGLSALWVGQHVFHLTGVAAHWQQTGSGDTALNWITAGIYVVLSVVGGLVWTLVSELRGKRKEYRTLHAWLRLLLRLTAGMFMMIYGFGKVFPLQMAPISIGILKEPVGNMSPMTMLWSMIGLHPGYEMICGAAEVTGGLLLLYRRTALLGAMIAAFVMTNVVLYNMFFDVPVKLFAISLLLAELYLIVPEVGSLFAYFWKHEPAKQWALWFPPIPNKRLRIATKVLEWAFCLGFVVMIPYSSGMAWRGNVKAMHTQSPLLGAWKVDGGQAAGGAFMAPDKEALGRQPVVELDVDAVNRAFRRSESGELWRTGLHLDAKNKTLTMLPYGGKAETYSWTMPDNDHLVLTSLAPKAAKGKAAQYVPNKVTLTRIPLPSGYFLMDRGFHWVNQWGYER